jgi:16S rRNA (guanine527-N7)-methyltransferase
VKRLWVERAAEFLRVDIDPAQIELLEAYTSWLEDEAISAGGIGPDEKGRLEKRHIVDSLLFASCFPNETDWVRDIGSGVGLPGIPLAVLLPDTDFELLDRSGRRVDLMRRAVRVLGLNNVEVVQGEIERISVPSPVLVSRAALSPAGTSRRANHLLTVGGTAILGGSWVKRPVHAGWKTVEIPRMVLDQPVWLLIMRRQ